MSYQLKDGDVVKVVPVGGDTRLQWPVGYVAEILSGAVRVCIYNALGQGTLEWFPIEYIHGPLRF